MAIKKEELRAENSQLHTEVNQLRVELSKAREQTQKLSEENARLNDELENQYEIWKSANAAFLSRFIREEVIPNFSLDKDIEYDGTTTLTLKYEDDVSTICI